jgi:hypothetical protein
MKPARVNFCRGRLVPLGSFSSDALGMPWELMGNNSFLRKISENVQIGRVIILQFSRKMHDDMSHSANKVAVNTTYSAAPILLQTSHKIPKNIMPARQQLVCFCFVPNSSCQFRSRFSDLIR